MPKINIFNTKITNIVRLLNVRYDNLTLDVAIKRAISLVGGQNKANMFFLNADCLYKAQINREYQYILNSADLVLPDGIGLKLAAALFGNRMKDNCNGTDFSPLLMEQAAKYGYKIFFLGGKEGVAKKAAENMRKRIPAIQIVGVNSGYFNNDAESIRKINNSKADILFVAMGVPLQEKWIHRNREKLNPKLCLGVGALFDYLSGRIKRAPSIMRILYLEWFWRLMMEPRRLWKRYLIDDMKFFWLVFKQKYNNQDKNQKY